MTDEKTTKQADEKSEETKTAKTKAGKQDSSGETAGTEKTKTTAAKAKKTTKPAARKATKPKTATGKKSTAGKKTAEPDKTTAAKAKKTTKPAAKKATKPKTATDATAQQAPADNKGADNKKKPAAKKDSSSKKTQEKTTAKKGSGRKSSGSGGKKKTTAKQGKKDAATTGKQGDTLTKLLINADYPEEARIALLENGKVDSYHVETVSGAQTKSNIYKGRIAAIEPSLQAVFVEMGTEKNGFLPFSDIHPEYYCKEVPENTHWKKLRIQEVLKKGQEVLVQVVKEATGNKGAGVTTYLSMPGRYVVLMPGSNSHGISRQIDDEPRRKKLREIVASTKLPPEIGYIVRTASRDITKTAMVKDIRYQLNLWKEIKKNGQTATTPALIYKEQNIISRFLRDHFTSDIQEILVDNQETYNQVEDFLKLLPARQQKTKVKLHQGARPIFNLFQVEEQIAQMYQPTVQLPSGGSIVINPTEALVAIDVNSGRTSKDKNFEASIFLANKEAAQELARQLRLRDLGGLVVVDFIDMRDNKHIREVEKQVKAALKRDKAKTDTSRISKFGLMQISRQRLGPPIQKGSFLTCQHCQGHGIIRSVETTALAYLRKIQTGAIKKTTSTISCRLPLTVAQYLLNHKRADIIELEKKYQVTIEINGDPAMKPYETDFQFQKIENRSKKSG